MYTLRLYHDSYAPSSATDDDLEAQHSIAYVLAGSVALNGQQVEQDQAVYCKDVATVQAGPDGAIVWRWELVRTEEPNNIAWGDGVTSRLRMSRRIRMFELVPTSKWLFRLDSIYNNRGSTGLHSHPGSGIRCMLKGHLRVESDKGESSDNNLTGDCWYEEGSYPLISTSDPGETADFLRGMVLPPEYARYPDTAVWIEGTKTCYSEWKSYAQTVVTLLRGRVTAINETIRSIHERHSVRRFTDRPVSDEHVTALLSAANQAPSAHNQQSWRFYVLRQTQKKAALADLITGLAGDFSRPSSTLLRMAAQSIASASAVIAVANTGELMQRGAELYQTEKQAGRDFFRTMEIQSSAAAVENLLLAATSLGIGSVWLGILILIKHEVLEFLGEPDGEFMAVVALGYPAKTTAGPRKRALEDVVRYLDE